MGRCFSKRSMIHLLLFLFLFLTGCAFSHLEGPCTVKTEVVCGEGGSKIEGSVGVIPVPIIIK